MSKIKNFFSFLKSVPKEMRKVSWLPKKELVNSTFIVISFVFVMLIFFGVSDFIVSNTFKLIFD